MSDEITQSVSVSSREEIDEKLSSILKNFNYEGEILQILKALLTETIYLNEIGAMVVLREGSLLTATQLDSIIALCHDNFTRVNRGVCQRLNVSNLICLQGKEIKAFDLLQTKGEYSLYYSEDATFETNQTNINLTLIVAKKQSLTSYDLEGDIDRRLSSDNFILEIPGDGWSEDFLFYRNDQKIYNVEDIPIEKHTEQEYYGNMYTKDAKRLNESIPYYIATTAPNYGIRVYSYNRFDLSDKYRFKGVKVLDEGVSEYDPKNLKEVTGFTFANNTPSVSSVDSIRPDSTKSYLKMQTVAYFRDRNYISSYNALKNAIELRLKDYFLGFVVNLINGQLIVTYVLKDGSEWNTQIQKEFLQEMIFDYKITEEIVFEKAQEKMVRLFLRVYYSNVIVEMEVLKAIDEFESKVGGVYTIDELKAELVKKIPNIQYIETISNTEEGYEWCVMREEDAKVALDEEIEVPIDPPPENPEDPQTTKKKVIYRLRFDNANNTENAQLPEGYSNKYIEYVSQTVDTI